METIGALILTIFTRLGVALGQIQSPTDRAYNERIALVYFRWQRTKNRLFRLWQRWIAGTLPKKRPSQAGIQRKRAPKPEGHKPYPSGHRWLKRDWQINGAGQWLLHNLSTQEFQDFITAVPQAARMIRPILKTLEIPAPAYMALPPRPRKPRPKKQRFKRDPKPPRVYGGIVARNAVRDIAGNIKATLATVRQTDYRSTG